MMADKDKAKPKKADPKYDELKNELDSILAGLQDDELDIDQALKAYGRGLELVKELEKYLKTAENTVREIKAGFERG